jgi:tetratricopeptide (TPR) repeat protein
MYNSKAVKCYEKGRALQQKGKLSEAETAYKKAIKINQKFVEAHSNLASVFLDRGKFREASDSFKKALKLLPDHPMLLNNIGNVLQVEGKNEEAIGWFNKAIMQDPNYAGAYSNLGNALRGLEKFEEAVVCYRRSIQIEQGVADRYHNLAAVLVELGELDEAITNFRKAIEVDPGQKFAYKGLGNALFHQDKLDEAIVSYHKAIDIDPLLTDAYNGLGNALAKQYYNASNKQDKLDEAIVSYHKAIEIDPFLKDAYNGLGNALSLRGELDKAVASYHKAIGIDPEYIDAYIGLGSVLSDKGEIAQAIAAHHKAIDIDPQHVDAYIGLGKALNDHGELDKAIASYRKAVAIDPECAEAYQFLSSIKKFSECDDDIRSMESLYVTKSISDEQKMQLAFGLGKAYEDIGEYEQAIEFIMEATRLKRASIVYSISETQDLIHHMKKIFSLEFFRKNKGIGNPDKTPIFILGMPRSGTSLVEQILASHPDVVGAGELKYVLDMVRKMGISDTSRKFPSNIIDVDPGAFEGLGKEYISRIRSFSETTKYITDKMPHNFLSIGFIKAILPNASIIHLTRDPMDNCLSIFKNNFLSGHHYSYDMTELGQYYNLYLDLMEYWRNTLPESIYDLSYERLVADQEGQTRKLLDYCELPWDDACLGFHKTRRTVKTASNTQVRRPIYKDSVKLWKRYEKQLEPLVAAIYG